MAYEEAPPPSEKLDKVVRAARDGCGCLYVLAVLLSMLTFWLSRLT